jgi:hypothetical protein
MTLILLALVPIRYDLVLLTLETTIVRSIWTWTIVVASEMLDVNQQSPC